MKSRLVKHLCSGALAATVLFQVLGRTGITTYAEMGADQQEAEEQSIEENGDDDTDSDNSGYDNTSNDEQGNDSTGNETAGNNDNNTGDEGIDNDEADDSDVSGSESTADVEDELEADAADDITDDEENVTGGIEADNAESETITIYYVAGEGGTIEDLPQGEAALTEVVVLSDDEELTDNNAQTDNALEADHSSSDEEEPAEESFDTASDDEEDIEIEGATASALDGYEFVNWTVDYDDSIVSTDETIEPSIEDLKALSAETSKVTYIANFKAAEATYKAAELSPTVHMSLTGRELQNGEFQFLMVATDVNGNELAGGYSQKTTNDADGNVVFPTITYEKPGTYYYKITQINDGKTGVTYDSTYYSLRVYVSQDPDDNTALKANTAYFKNSNAVPITVRMYDYDEAPINDGYTLKFSDGGNNKFKVFNRYVGKQKGVYQGIVATDLGADGYPYLSSATTKSSESLSYLFNYNTNGVGSYDEDVVLYQASGDGSYSYSSNSFYPFGDKNYLFGVMTETAFTISEDGKTKDGKDMTYTFSGDDDVWVYVDGKLVIDLGGIHDAYGAEVNFNTGAITYYNPKEGGAAPANTYISNLSEVFPSGWKDGNIHEIKIFYFERGKYLSNYTSVFNFDLAAIFSNTYVADVKETTPVKTSITGTKTLTGRDLTEGEFTFLLYETESDFIVSGDPVKTAVNKADGSFAFDEIEYKEAGEYFYVVKEQIPAEAILNEDGSYTYNDVTYDAKQVNVKVTVTADSNGVLSLTVATSAAIEFTNTYKTPDEPETPQDPKTPSNPSTPSETTETTTQITTETSTQTSSETPTQIGAPPIAITDEGEASNEPAVLGETRLAVTDEEESVLGQSRNHDTGDDYNIAKNLIIIFAAATAIVVLVLVSRKRRAH